MVKTRLVPDGPVPLLRLLRFLRCAVDVMVVVAREVRWKPFDGAGQREQLLENGRPVGLGVRLGD